MLGEELLDLFSLNLCYVVVGRMGKLRANLCVCVCVYVCVCI